MEKAKVKKIEAGAYEVTVGGRVFFVSRWDSRTWDIDARDRDSLPYTETLRWIGRRRNQGVEHCRTLRDAVATLERWTEEDKLSNAPLNGPEWDRLMGTGTPAKEDQRPFQLPSREEANLQKPWDCEGGRVIQRETETNPSTKGPSTAAIRTLKYWSPGPYSDAVQERFDGDTVLRIAFDGMAECLDGGLLYHVASVDAYRLTGDGFRLLDQLRRKAAPVEVAR